MNFRSRLQRRRSTTVIELTSLLDVMFLLLTFLLVTSQFRQEDQYAFVLEPPSASSKQATVTINKTTVYVGKDGSIRLFQATEDDAAPAGDAQPITIVELDRRLRQVYREKPDTPIAIRGDKDTTYQQIMNVWSVVQEVGFREISFPYQYQKPGTEPAPSK